MTTRLAGNGHHADRNGQHADGYGQHGAGYGQHGAGSGQHGDRNGQHAGGVAVAAVPGARRHTDFDGSTLRGALT
jgi:hypothetical protein